MMRAPVMSASVSIAWNFGILAQASSSRRCSSARRIRVRRFCTLNRFTPLAERIDKVLPLDRLRQNRLERIQFAIHRSGFDRIGGRPLLECAPGSDSCSPTFLAVKSFSNGFRILRRDA